MDVIFLVRSCGCTYSNGTSEKGEGVGEKKGSLMFPAMVPRRSFAESTGTRRGKRVARTLHTFFSSSLG